MTKAMEDFYECGGSDLLDPVEKLRFYLCCMIGKEFGAAEWIEVEQFFDLIQQEDE